MYLPNDFRPRSCRQKRLHTDVNNVSRHCDSDPETTVKPKNRPGPARPGHLKIALDITAVDIDQFFLSSTATMIIYDRLSL